MKDLFKGEELDNYECNSKVKSVTRKILKVLMKKR